MLQALILANQKTGYANFTEFVFESRSVTSTSIQKYFWNISDGTTYLDTSRITHKFFNSGTYTIKLTVWDENNVQQSTAVTIFVQQFLSDSIYFQQIPEYISGPSVKTETPFIVSFTTTITSQPPVVSLYADNSRSIPYNAPIKPTWNELIPRWRFYDTNNTVVTEITATNYTPVYFEGVHIGYRGTVSFYFVEDIGINNPYTEQPTVIFATLKTSTQLKDRLNSTQNTVQKATFWYTDKPIPTKLVLSETIISDIYNFKWSGIKIPYLITVGWDNNSYKTDINAPQAIKHFSANSLKKHNNNILFSYPDKNIASKNLQRSVTNTFNVLPSSLTTTQETSADTLSAIEWGSYTLTYPTPTSVQIDFFVKEELGITNEYPVLNAFFVKEDAKKNPASGFTFDSVYIHAPVTRNVSLSTSLTIPASTYTPSFFHTTNLLVYNPEVKLFNKIYNLPHTFKNITHNKLIYDKVLETEWLKSFDLNETFSTYTTSKTPPTDLYSIVYDPIDRVYWATDPENNLVYKLNNNFNVLTAINFVSYFDVDSRFPNKNKLPYDRSTPLHVKIDKNRDIWISFYDQLDLIKIDKNGTILHHAKHKLLVRDAPVITDKVKERNLSIYSLIDIDSQNNVWATHTEYLFNELRKYNSTGTLLSTIPLPSIYNPTSIHIDRHDNVWVTAGVTPYLLKPSQDRYGLYWDWFNLKEKKSTPLKWKDTRFVGLTNWVTEREIYPAGKYPKTWNRETFNGMSLKQNFTFTLTNSSRVVQFNGLSTVMPDITGIDLYYDLEMLILSSTPALPAPFILSQPVSALNVFYINDVVNLIPPVSAKINFQIPSLVSKYYPGLYNTDVNYITANERIIIEVPKQRKVYNYLPKLENYGLADVIRPSAVVVNSELSATEIRTISAMDPNVAYEIIPGDRVFIQFNAKQKIPLRSAKYPISALPIQNIITNYEPGMFFRVYNYNYYTQNAHSFANTFFEYSNYRYNTITTDDNVEIKTNLFPLPLYFSENNLITNQISSIYDPITSAQQVIPSNYGNLYCFSSGGNLLKNYFNNFERPESVITDNDNKIWLTHNYNHFSYLDPVTDNLQTWKIDTETGYIFSVTNLLSSKLEPNSTTDPTKVFNNGIRGLHVDMFNRIWLVSNNQQKAYTFYAPNLTQQYRAYNANLQNKSNERHSLTQSFGDPTGNLWFRKYVTADVYNTLNYILTGVSNTFTVAPFEDTHYFRVKNESFDAKNQYKSYALPETLNNNTVLFEDFLGSILGQVSDNRENIGRNLFEKIANFTQNHSDIDRANIKSLYSLGQMLGIEVEQGLSNLAFPAEVRRLLNIVSIPYKKLFGYINKNQKIKDAYLEPLSTEYSLVTAGEILYVENLQTSDNFTYIVPVSAVSEGYLPINTPIPVLALDIPQLKNYIFTNSIIYRVTFSNTETYSNNFIDWGNEKTRLLSSTNIQDWYKDNGVIEQMFNYLLTKNLLT